MPPAWIHAATTPQTEVAVKNNVFNLQYLQIVFCFCFCFSSQVWKNGWSSWWQQTMKLFRLSVTDSCYLIVSNGSGLFLNYVYLLNSKHFRKGPLPLARTCKLQLLEAQTKLTGVTVHKKNHFVSSGLIVPCHHWVWHCLNTHCTTSFLLL